MDGQGRQPLFKSRDNSRRSVNGIEVRSPEVQGRGEVGSVWRKCIEGGDRGDSQNSERVDTPDGSLHQVGSEGGWMVTGTVGMRGVPYLHHGPSEWTLREYICPVFRLRGTRSLHLPSFLPGERDGHEVPGSYRARLKGPESP